MKARLISIAAAVLFVFCVRLSPTTEALVTQPPDAEALAKKNGCTECHSVEKKLVGPAFRDIAAKYKDNDRARSALVEKVKKGGKGNWTEVTGGVPMPAHSPRLSDADIRRLVDWVLSLAAVDQ
jgi:cytochrome c